MRGALLSRRLVQRYRQLLLSVAGSVKINLLLCLLIAFTLVVLGFRSAYFISWNHSSYQLPDRSATAPHRKGYSILINTWKRNDLLMKSIAHYISCPRLDSIHIVWSEPDPPSDSLVKYLEGIIQSNSRDGHGVELKFDINKEDSLNNRFKEIKDLKTDAVFSIDDDVIFPCSSVELAFSVWQSAPDTMVGFVPRMHWLDKSDNKGNRYTYGGWWSVWWMGTYSMVLSKAAFFHKKYLRTYTYEMPASLREYIARNRNCEDIAMSFLVANATSAPPIWVKAKIFEIGTTGISSMGDHIERRSQCVNRFVAEYGRMPLVSTSMKAIDSRTSWFW